MECVLTILFETIKLCNENMSIESCYMKQKCASHDEQNTRNSNCRFLWAMTCEKITAFSTNLCLIGCGNSFAHQLIKHELKNNTIQF